MSIVSRVKNLRHRAHGGAKHYTCFTGRLLRLPRGDWLRGGLARNAKGSRNARREKSREIQAQFGAFVARAFAAQRASSKIRASRARHRIVISCPNSIEIPARLV